MTDEKPDLGTKNSAKIPDGFIESGNADSLVYMAITSKLKSVLYVTEIDNDILHGYAVTDGIVEERVLNLALTHPVQDSESVLGDVENLDTPEPLRDILRNRHGIVLSSPGCT